MKEYTIRDIKGRKEEDGVRYYYVFWEDYTEDDCTWEPFKHFAQNCHIVHEYDAREDGVSIEQAAKGCPYCPKIKEIDQGSYFLGDRAAQLVAYKKKRQRILIKVIWKPRESGLIPKPTWVPSEQVKQEAPDLLYEFYQKKIKWVLKSNNSCFVVIFKCTVASSWLKRSSGSKELRNRVACNDLTRQLALGLSEEGLAWKLLQLEVEIQQTGASDLSKVSQLNELYMRACQKLQAKSDSRYLYFKNKMTSLMLRPNVALRMGEAQLAAELRKSQLVSQHKIKLSVCGNTDQEKQKLIQRSKNQANKEQSLIQKSIQSQRSSIQKRLIQRRIKSKTKSRGRKETNKQNDSLAVNSERECVLQLSYEQVKLFSTRNKALR